MFFRDLVLQTPVLLWTLTSSAFKQAFRAATSFPEHHVQFGGSKVTVITQFFPLCHNLKAKASVWPTANVIHMGFTLMESVRKRRFSSDGFFILETRSGIPSYVTKMFGRHSKTNKKKSRDTSQLQCQSSDVR